MFLIEDFALSGGAGPVPNLDICNLLLDSRNDFLGCLYHDFACSLSMELEKYVKTK